MDYVTADLHFNHTGLLNYPERAKFRSIDEHDEFIIGRLNATLKPEDTLYILGDVGFRNGTGPQGLYDLGLKVRRIECARKILVFGNHDHFSVHEAISRLGFSEAHLGPVYYESPTVPGAIILSHEPVREAYDNPYVINVHGHVHNYALNARGFHNVNIGLTDFHPVEMQRFVDLAKNLKSRNEKFGHEWYYGYYDFSNGGKK